MKLYVGNLSYEVTEDQLKGVFQNYGAPSEVKLITDRETGKSKGYGFVEITDEATGQKAIQELNGTDLNGRALRVSEAKEREPRSGGGGGGGGRRFGGGGGGGGGRFGGGGSGGGGRFGGGGSGGGGRFGGGGGGRSEGGGGGFRDDSFGNRDDSGSND